MSDPERPTPEPLQVPDTDAVGRLDWVMDNLLEVDPATGEENWRDLTFAQMRALTPGGEETSLVRILVEAAEEVNGGHSFVDFLEALREGEERGFDPETLAENREFYEPTLLYLLERDLGFTAADPTQALFTSAELEAIRDYFEARGEDLSPELADWYANLREDLTAAVEIEVPPEAEAEAEEVEEAEESTPFEELMAKLGLDEDSAHKEVAKIVRQYARLEALGQLRTRDSHQIQRDFDQLLRADAPEGQIVAVAGYLQGLLAVASAREAAAQRGMGRDKAQVYQKLAEAIPVIAGVEISGEFYLSAEDERQLLEDPLVWFRERFGIVENVGEAEVTTHFQYLQSGYRFFYNNKAAYAGRKITFRKPNGAREEEPLERDMFEAVEEEYAARLSFIHVFRSWVGAHSFKDIQINPEVFRHGRFEWLWERLAPVIWELERPDHIRAYLNAEERTDRLAAYLGDKDYARGHELRISEDNIHDAVSERWGNELRAAWGLKEGEEIPFWVVRLGYFFWRFNGRAALFDGTAVDVHKILAVTSADSKQAQGVKKSLEDYLAKQAPGLKARVKRDIEVLPGEQSGLRRTREGVVQLNGRVLIDSQGAIIDDEMKRQILLHYVEFGTVPKALTVGSGEAQGVVRVDIEDPEAVMKQIPEFDLSVSGSLLTAYLHRRGAYDTFARKLFALDYNYLTRGRGIAFARQALKTGFFDYISFLEHRFKSGDPSARALSDKAGEAVLVQNPREFIGAMANKTGARSIEEERGLVRQMSDIRFTDYKDTDISDWVGSGVTLENALQNLEQFLADPGSFISTGNKVFFDLYTSDKLVFLLYQDPQNPELMERLGVANRKEEFILNLLKVAVSGLIGYTSEEKEAIASTLVRTTFIDPTGGPHRQLIRQIGEKAFVEMRAAYVMGVGWYAVAKAKSAASLGGSIIGAAGDAIGSLF